MTRQRKTPRQRAEEALAVANRKVTRLNKERHRLKTDLDRVTHEHEQAVIRRDYLAKHPDLEQQNRPTTQEDQPA